MTAVKRLWIPVLVAVLVAMLVGPAGVTAAGPRATVRTVTIPAAAFTPQDDDVAVGYENLGYQMTVVGPSVAGTFVAPLFFEAPEVRIKKIVLFAYDNNGASSVCVNLYRSTPANGYRQEMGEVCSTGATTGVRVFTQKTISPRKITVKHGPYLELYIPGVYSSGYQFYALRITYSY